MSSPRSEAEQRALDYGLDLSLIEKNLSLSVEARIEAHEDALALVLQLEKVRKSIMKSGT